MNSEAVPEAQITEPAILFRISKVYRSDMTALELYEATRGFWRLGKKLSARAEAAQLAFAVYQGVIREVYRIESWHPAGTLPYTSRDPGPYRGKNRREFSGPVATDLRNRYVGHSVRHHFPQGNRAPFKYVNCSTGPD
ncbi:MAG: hypothetical protein AB7O66_19040 [Limisphaerales bacterium]